MKKGGLFLGLALVGVVGTVAAAQIAMADHEPPNFGVSPQKPMTPDEQKAFDLMVKHNSWAGILLFDQKCKNRMIPKAEIARIRGEWDALDEDTKKTEMEKNEKYRDHIGREKWCRQVIDLMADARLYDDVVQVEPALTGAIHRSATDPRTRTTRVLMVVENRHWRNFRSTEWNCTFYRNNQPIYEQKIYVDRVDGFRQTAQTSTAFIDWRFEGVNCKLRAVLPVDDPQRERWIFK
jgi:hypothetical protein